MKRLGVVTGVVILSLGFLSGCVSTKSVFKLSKETQNIIMGEAVFSGIGAVIPLYKGPHAKVAAIGTGSALFVGKEVSDLLSDRPSSPLEFAENAVVGGWWGVLTHRMKTPLAGAGSGLTAGALDEGWEILQSAGEVKETGK